VNSICASPSSPATAYRYFPSLDELLNTYLHDVIIGLRDYSHDCPKTGKALFEDVVHEWGRLLTIYGRAMIQLRSRQGFLERLRGDDEVIGTVRDAWERPVRAVMRKLDIPDDQLDYVLFLYSIIFDPREVLDLVGRGLSVDDALDRLIAAYYGALRGWAGH
jgi:AcrR family transcriptional regulator